MPMVNEHPEEGAGAGERGPQVTRRALIGGVMGAGLLSIGSSWADSAMAGEPIAFRADALNVYTRSQWNARPPKQPARIIGRPPDRIVIHHTATANSGERSLDHAFDLSRNIQTWHMDGNEWNDAGQQLTISRGGIVMEGRNRSLQAIRAKSLAVGAHALHHNDHTIGIENEGDYRKGRVPPRMWDSLVEVCVWLCRAYDLGPSEAIIGHRDLNSTSCPGDALYARLPELRRAVAAKLAGSGGGRGSADAPIMAVPPSFDGFG
ncbi:MAG: peptidoglycan recognition protein family protein [Actinomadura sp.]